MLEGLEEMEQEGGIGEVLEMRTREGGRLRRLGGTFMWFGGFTLCSCLRGSGNGWSNRNGWSVRYIFIFIVSICICQIQEILNVIGYCLTRYNFSPFCSGIAQAWQLRAHTHVPNKSSYVLDMGWDGPYTLYIVHMYLVVLQRSIKYPRRAQASLDMFNKFSDMFHSSWSQTDLNHKHSDVFTKNSFNIIVFCSPLYHI